MRITSPFVILLRQYSRFGLYLTANAGNQRRAVRRVRCIDLLYGTFQLPHQTDNSLTTGLVFIAYRLLTMGGHEEQLV